MTVKRLLKFFKYLIISLAIFILLTLVVINLPVSQRIITGKANALFQERNLPVQVGRITLLINGKIGLDQLKIINNQEDTIVSVRQLRVSARLFPLLFKKVRVKSIVLNNASVYLTADASTGVIDLISLFSHGDRSPKTKAKSGKKWYISVESAVLKSVRFTYDDAFRGIQINETVGKLFITLDDFSLADRDLYASILDLEDANGGITLKGRSGNKRDTIKKTSVPWKFRLTKGDLRDIMFTLHQPDKDRQMKFSLAKGDISDAGVDLGGSTISVKKVNLDNPGILSLSLHTDSKRGSGPESSSGKGFPGPWNISGRDIKITNMSYHTGAYNNQTSSGSDNGPLQVASLDASLKDFLLNSGESRLNMERLTFTLENGFQLERGEMVFSSDPTPKSMLEAKFRSASSRVNLKVEIGNKLAALIKSFNTVPFKITIDDTKISAVDLQAFIPRPKEKYSKEVMRDLWLAIDCSAEGTASQLNISKITVNTPSGISLFAAGQLDNITKPSSAVCSVNFSAENITSSRLSELIHMSGSSVKLPDFGALSLKGNISDSLTAPRFFIALRTASDSVTADGSVNIHEKKYSINVAGYSMDLGNLAGIKDLGDFSGVIHLAGEGFKTETMKIQAELSVDSVIYRKYNYHNIEVKIDGNEGHHRFKINADDPSFACDLGGTVSLGKVFTGATVSGSFMADAGKLNFYDGIRAQGKLEAAYDKAADGMTSSLSLKNLTLSSVKGSEELENLSVSFQSSDTLLDGRVQSDFMEAAVHVKGSADDIRKAFSQGKLRLGAIVDSTVSNRIPIISLLPETTLSLEATYNPIIGILLNDSLFSYNKVSASLIKDSTGNASSQISIDRFNLGKGGGFGTTLHFASVPDTTTLTVSADSVKFGNIKLADLSLNLATTMDTALYSLKASDKNDRLLYDIEGLVRKNGNKIIMKATQPEWTLNGFRWTMGQEDFLIMEPEKRELIANLHLRKDESTIDIRGSTLEKILIEYQKVWLNMLFIPGMNTFGYDGELTGKIDFSGKDKKELAVQMNILHTKLNENPVGDFKISARYLSDTLGTAEADLNAVLNDTSSMIVTFRSGTGEIRKSLVSEFSGIPLHIFESLVKKYVSGLQGEVSGGLRFTSTGDKPHLDGEMRVNKAELKVVALNSSFYLPDNIIKLENNKLVLTKFTVLDSLKKQLSVNGTINLENLHDITADLQVTSDRIQVLNTTEKDNPSFNGSVFVDSKLSITGPVQSPSIAGSIVLAEGTMINYMYAENLTVSETEKTITFASLSNQEKTGDTVKVPSKSFTRLPDIDAEIEINPNSLFNFKISKGFDIGVQITGGGFLTYALTPSKNISLTGTYEINQGNAALKLPGWPRKDFSITPGSYLKWDGQVDDPELNLETISKVRGSYYNPVDEQNREVNFLVNMKLSGRLSQLEILFDVSSQDQYITTVFNSLSKDERMKQAINLLIFGRIELPNVTSSSDYVSQQINQFWETQINQITKSVFKNVDVSLGIDTFTGAAKEGGGEGTYTSFTYEVKKSLFRDRASVLVSGRMNDNSTASQQSSNLIENFIFEYAIDSIRTKFIKVYRQQNYEDLLEGEVTKSGVGFIYRKNYDRLRDIWRRKKSGNKK